MEISFKNLPKLLNSMRAKEWIIDSFIFKYKEENFIIILKTYQESEKKPHPYAKAKLEFIRETNVEESIFAYCDFYEVKFHSVDEFVEFFKIAKGNADRKLFKDFSEIFAGYIPSEKNENKSYELTKIQGSRCEGNDPNAIYCYDVRRNGSTDGHKHKRSIENSNKAQTLRPFLFNKYKADDNLSFYFSPDENDDKTDEEIIALVAKRKS